MPPRTKTQEIILLYARDLFGSETVKQREQEFLDFFSDAIFSRACGNSNRSKIEDFFESEVFPLMRVVRATSCSDQSDFDLFQKVFSCKTALEDAEVFPESVDALLLLSAISQQPNSLRERLQLLLNRAKIVKQLWR